MPTRFTWAFETTVRPASDPTAAARREAREAAERRLSALLDPWQVAAHSRRRVHGGAEEHWLDFTVKPQAVRLQARIARLAEQSKDCQGSAEPAQTDEERQQLAEELLEELQRPDNGFVRGGGAAVAAAIEMTNNGLHDFLVEQIIAINNKDAQPAGA